MRENWCWYLRKYKKKITHSENNLPHLDIQFGFGKFDGFCKRVGSIWRYSTFNFTFASVCTREEPRTGFPVLGSSLVHNKAKVKLNVEYLQIDPTILQNPSNLPNPDWIYKCGRLFSESVIFFLYFLKYQH